MKVALSVGVQKMVRSDKAGCRRHVHHRHRDRLPGGCGHQRRLGTGRNVVQGTVTPDEYVVFKPPWKNREHPDYRKNPRREGKEDGLRRGGTNPTKTSIPPSKERLDFVLSDEEILHPGPLGLPYRGQHYGKPMDIEWAKDGETGLYIVQARPETVQSRKDAGHLKTLPVVRGRQGC
jgi:pyruvate, water dikinase